MLKHLPHYVTLFSILFAAFFGLVLFPHDRNFQISVAVASAAAYIAWGVVHHLLHKDFYIEVLFEYFAIAVLGLTIIFSLIIRS